MAFWQTCPCQDSQKSIDKTFVHLVARDVSEDEEVEMVQSAYDALDDDFS